MNGGDLKKAFIFSCHKYFRDCTKTIGKTKVNIDDGQMGGTHWNCVYIKVNKSLYFDSFGSLYDRVLLNQLPKPITFHICIIQDSDSRTFCSYSLYFCYLIERIDHYNAVLKIFLH